MNYSHIPTLEEIQQHQDDPGNAWWDNDDVQVVDFKIEDPEPEPDVVNTETVFVDPDKTFSNIPAKKPLKWAKAFLDDCFSHADRHTFLKWRDEIYIWRRGAWRRASKDQVAKAVYLWGDRCFLVDGDKTTDFNPDIKKVREVISAATAFSSVDDETAQPALLGQMDINPEMALAMQNGVVDLRSNTIVPPSPLFFSTSCIKFEFNKSAPPPDQWFTFLDDIWGNDPEAISTLQEMFGYLLTSITSMQKAFMIIGPKRSGKGTIARVLGELGGMDAIVAPTLASLSTNFGMAPLIGKKVALIADARMSSRTDTAIIAERILSVTGEDIQSIDRKNLSAWNGKLTSRFVIMSNILPRFMDASGALTSRMVILKMTKSFYNQEDPNLFEHLRKELPGILLWALQGLERLRRRGHFIQPKSSQQMVSDLNDLASNVSKFVREECDVGDENYMVERIKLYEEWKLWCQNNGIKPGSTTTFKNDLISAFPTIFDRRMRGESGRDWYYCGLRLQAKVGF